MEEQMDIQMSEEESESKKSIDYTTTNVISMVNAFENENRSTKYKLLRYTIIVK